MITLSLAIIFSLILFSSLKKIKQLKNEYMTFEIKLRELHESMESSRKILQNKLNRNLALQKQLASEIVPKITFQKLGVITQALLPSDTVYSLADDEGHGLSGTCEGNGDCGLCAMSILSGAENFDPITDIEKEILEKLDYPKGTRLSCQAKIRGDATVNFMSVEGQA